MPRFTDAYLAAQTPIATRPHASRPTTPLEELIGTEHATPARRLTAAEQADIDQRRTINLAPSPAALQAIARLAIDQIVKDAPPKRQRAVRALLHSVIDCTRYFAASPEHQHLIVRMLADVE